MSPDPVPGEGLFRLLLRLHPRDFRARYGDEMTAFFREAWRDQAEGRGPWAMAAFWARTVLGTATAALAQRAPGGSPAGSGDPRERLPGRSGPAGGGLRETAAGWWADLARDVRYAFRSLARQPGFTAVTIVTLALGIGANAAVFSVLHSVLLTPLPYEEPERLVRMYWEEPDGRSYLPNPAFLDFREHLESVRLAAIRNYRETGADLVVEGRPERVRTLGVSAEYFEVLGGKLVLGRPFRREEERGDARVAVVSERLWTRALGGDPAAVGRALDLDGVSHRVVGVVSGSFEDPVEGPIDVWLPGTFDSAPWQWQNDVNTVVGRLAPGVSLTRAQSEVTLRSQLQVAMEENPLEEARGVLVPLRDDVVGAAEPMLLILMGAVGLLLAITCVNVMSLVLARGAGRARELSIRAALGSGRARLIRQLLVESLVLAAAGGGAGLLVGAFVQEALVGVAPAALPGATSLGYGWPVALFAGAVALLVGLAVGSVPALRLTRPGLEAGVRGEARGGAERMGQQRLRGALVVAEVSLALVLLVGAGLLLGSLERLRSVDLGADPGDVWTFQVHLPDARYDADQRARFHQALHERLRAIPGVQAAGAASRLPATGSYHGPWGTRADRDGAPTLRDAQNRVIEGDWFGALDIRLLEGRLFGPRDGPDAPRRAVVSESLARRLFPGESAVGRRIRVLGDPLEVIGVVEEVALTPRGRPAPTVYHAHAQMADERNWPLFQVVEVARPLPGLVERARVEVAGLDPSLIVVEPRPLAAVLGRESARERFASLLLAAFAALAVALAALGIYGILAYDVSRSRHEIGVRMALGAGRGDVRRMVVRRGLTLTAAGVGIGTVGALASSRLLRSLLFEVSPTDPRVFAVAVAAILAIGAVASWVPARRATAVEPADAFRAG